MNIEMTSEKLYKFIWLISVTEEDFFERLYLPTKVGSNLLLMSNVTGTFAINE